METASDGRAPGQTLRHARQLLESGQLPPVHLVGAVVAQSWRRSMDAGLTPWRGQDGAHLSAPDLTRAIDRRRELVTRARPVMEYLHAQTRGSGSMVILADEGGVLLDTLGDADFLNRAERVALMPGASWHEAHRGTNAIGTALAESAPVSVHGGEHFLEHNSFLTCAAAPVAGPDGRLLGVLDISGHRRGRHPHTAGLVSAAAHMIENRLFEARHEGGLRLRLHPQPDGIGTLAEGLLALDGDGRIIGANRAAIALLGLAPGALGQVRVQDRLAVDLDGLLDWGQGRSGAPFMADSSRGQRLFLRVEAPPRKPRVSVATPASRDALSALESGDAVLAQAVAKARKVVGKDIALLLMGESGVGKEVFAHAAHASGPRAAGPFVAVNCAALPEHLIEAELFGYAPGAFTGARRDGSPGRIRQAHGGTLFLDEIGDMPLSMQTRLLRVLQDREVIPLGGGKAVRVDFALMAATHQPLKQAVADGRFRADLYYRLNGLSLTLPPLRGRADLQALVARILDTIEPGGGLALSAQVAQVAQAFADHCWPGNIRQLANVLRTAAALLEPGETRIRWQHLPEDLVDEMRAPPCPEPGAMGDLRAVSDAVMERTLAACGGNVSRAAKQLGVSRNTLYRRLRHP
ncbi:sigma-54-dependent Fis family transcriptional regulator [Magnetospirillum sp. 64-120]|uniref:sigma-54-dependent Fis family transcriptional regulator n=1 Tax=Magnetospirillum sp. 64-120 TaxID=1895778 RepID=UPI0009283848|nr:sigma-54-dependent Fis family transcriptional regulator [Magnetospirillum sp. 64-120]OJX67248.1 MAG: sigma-54-dependent Fis family transcriptional regulator [Magnetospirillum sp. 64-120]